jgi:hypothetical protein
MDASIEPTVNPDRVLQAQARCAHAACSCLVAPGEQYCSDACRSAPAGGSCSCNHPGCAQSGQMSVGRSPMV